MWTLWKNYKYNMKNNLDQLSLGNALLHTTKCLETIIQWLKQLKSEDKCQEYYLPWTPRSQEEIPMARKEAGPFMYRNRRNLLLFFCPSRKSENLSMEILELSPRDKNNSRMWNWLNFHTRPAIQENRLPLQATSHGNNCDLIFCSRLQT